MRSSTALLPLLFGAHATLAASSGVDLRVGYEASRAKSAYHDGSDSGSPPDPAFPFTDLCDAWSIQYLVDGGELSLWTACPEQPRSEVIALLALDSSLVANTESIKPAYPSNSAPQSFSSVCKDCALSDPLGSVMACNCSTNGGAPLLAVDLAEWITSVQGVTCFTDGVVCGAVQSTVQLPSPEPQPSVTGTQTLPRKSPQCSDS